MTNDEIKEIFKSITYKPNWTLRLVERPDWIDMWQYHFRYNTVDSADRTSKRQIESVGKLDGEHLRAMDRQQFIDYIFNIIEGMEEHETREWFRVNNVAIFDPHT